jgi:hypothetical protein
MLEEVIKLSISKVHIPVFNIVINAGGEEMSLMDFGIPGKVISSP